MAENVIWSADCNMDEISLRKESDGTFTFTAGTQGEYGEPTVFLDRQKMEELYSAIEQELYPERNTKPVAERIQGTAAVIFGA